ncbi:MAG: hypothetical protein ACI9CF_001373, partial [Candidatus Omnitrophota bacterium]
DICRENLFKKPTFDQHYLTNMPRMTALDII